MSENIWIGIGLFGQVLFFMRFLVQWIASEKKQESVIPISFWYLSLSGALVLLTYSIYRRDVVFILGQSTGFLIYTRNLYFIYKKQHAGK